MNTKNYEENSTKIHNNQITCKERERENLIFHYKRKKDTMCIGPKIRITTDFSTERHKLQDNGTTSLTY